ncbi:MAG: 54S ribosomal protein L2 mitochondrial [Watsoniomyces obsoletus]|nr:MAG: 54S ribosomal protein L2 mitochondrial [Watsoniomyces obsoletus]
MSYLRPPTSTTSCLCSRPRNLLQSLTSLLDSRPSLIPLNFQRHASHAQQGSVNGPKNGPGPRLGAKKSGGQYVIPGNIIFRQRGTLWFPGTNCGIGRDHTIYATQAGYVNYYRNPTVHPKRKYIGVAFEKDHMLPYPPNAPRHRRLGMVAVPMTHSAAPDIPPAQDTEAVPEEQVTRERKEAPKLVTIHPSAKNQPIKTLHLRPNYSYREGNWEIGRAAERAGIKIREYQRGDRFLAWRKTSKRKAANVERRGLLKRTQKPKKVKKGGRKIKMRN